MKITVMFFAALRERMKSSEKNVECSEGESAGEVARRIVGFDDCLAFAVNDELVQREYRLRDGDRLALIPPMAGG